MSIGRSVTAPALTAALDFATDRGTRRSADDRAGGAVTAMIDRSADERPLCAADQQAIGVVSAVATRIPATVATAPARAIIITVAVIILERCRRRCCHG
jgi:hypothetical protein